MFLMFAKIILICYNLAYKIKVGINYMKENRLILNLVKYIIIFTIVITIIGAVISFFYRGISDINSSVSIDSDYSKLNLYLLNITKDSTTITKYGLVDNEDTSSYYVTFTDFNGNTNTFIKIEDKIYFNKIKLCDNVEEFKVIIDKSEKESISVEVILSGKKFNSQYVLV